MSPLSIGITTGIAIGIIFLMRPRRFYIVRHGETLLNASHIKQGAEGRLSELGKQQAGKVGTRLALLHIQEIIASPYERTRETTAIINKHLRVPISYSPLLVERRNPSEIIGKNRDDHTVVRIVDQMDLAYHEDEYRFSDEENFIDLRDRARKCLNLLARQGAHTTCVITHHVFLKMLLACMLYRERLHASDYAKLSFFNMVDNAGISICEYHPWLRFSRTCGWKVVSFNETI
ncbi:MAG: histidine phosphatase family protein [Candidatus Kaiserbacteria bacterium]|nr:histidine phosphatase family protein [Candidatus Kaiserbacteria bacterium]